MKKFKLTVTFSHYGTKETVKESFGGGNIIDHTIEVSENEGTDKEFHSGTYTEIIELDTTKDLRTQTFWYIQKNNKEYYFNLLDMEDNIILSETTKDTVMYTENISNTEDKNDIKDFFINLDLKKQKDLGNYSFYKTNDNTVEIDYTGGEWVSAVVEIDKAEFDKFDKLSNFLLSLDWK